MVLREQRICERKEMVAYSEQLWCAALSAMGSEHCMHWMHTVLTKLATGKDAVTSTRKAHTVTMAGFSCLVLK